MSEYTSVEEMIGDFQRYGSIDADGVSVNDPDGLQEHVIDRLAFSAVFGKRDVLSGARWLIWETSQTLGCRAASMHDYYQAGGQGRWEHRTTPAINIRGMTYDVARAAFQAAAETSTGQLTFELSRGDIDRTDQRPYEYAASVLAAAIREGYQEPVFLQGGRLQISPARYAENPKREIESIQGLALEAIGAGFYNFQIDGSPLVDLSADDTANQEENARRSAEIAGYIRRRQPAGVVAAIGVGIGSAGDSESTIAALREFMEQVAEHIPHDDLSKIGVQPVTSADQERPGELQIDLDLITELSAIARHEYGLGVTIQFDLSSFPAEGFERLTSANVSEIRLANAIHDLVYDSQAFPADVREEIYAWLDRVRQRQRPEEQTDDEFHYANRHVALGPFKQRLWRLEDEVRSRIREEAANWFEQLYLQLQVTDTAAQAAELPSHPRVARPLPRAIRNATAAGD